MDEAGLSHLDDRGRARMVDVGGKPETERWAVARADVLVSPETLRRILEGDVKKGDVRRTAELAGVMAAKRTPELIPLCHPVPLSHVEVRAEPDEALPGIRITATARATSKTGVEMESLTAAAVAALTVYDMIKGLDRRARIADVRLVEKHGGKGGDYVLDESAP